MTDAKLNQSDLYFDHRNRLLNDRYNNIKLIALWIAPLLFLLLFYFFPLSSILRESFARSGTDLAAPFRTIFTSSGFRKVLGFTFYQATLSTLLTLCIGLPAAYLVARYRFRGKKLLLSLTAIPFVLPTVVVAAALNALLGPSGWINYALMTIFDLSSPPIRVINSLGAILVAHVFYNTTIVLRMVGDYWSHIDPRVSQAAYTLGANRWQTLREVVLPLLTPAISAAALLVFIFNFTSFGVILILGGPRFATIEVEIYNQTIGLFNLPIAAALSVIQLLCTLGFTILYTQLSRRVTRPLNLRPVKFTQKRLITWKSRIFAGLMVTFLSVLFIAPIFALAVRSFSSITPTRQGRTSSDITLTTAYYRELAQNRRDSLFYVPPINAILVSLGYAAITVLLAIALGLPAAWYLARGTNKTISNILDPLIMLPLGTSAVTLGLGFIIALGRPPLNLRASPLLIPLAHTLVAFPFVVRSLVPSIQSIKPRIRQAAFVMGASPLDVFRKVDLPLVGRALIVATTFAFTISMGEFGATALIARPEYPTIPLMIYRLISQPGSLNYGQAMALSTILMLITALGMLAIERFRIAEIGEF